METLFIGKNLLFLTEVESTNTYAMDMLRNVNTIEGTVVYTNYQTKGRGQRGSLWSSETASNITASIVLKPQFLSIEKSFYLSKISALALYDVLAEMLPVSQYDIKIKWPNDILVNKSKISGVLIENVFHQHNIHYSVIGVGLNVNQTQFRDLENSATSLKKIIGKELDRQLILEKLCIYLEKWYLLLKTSRFTEINSHYQQHLFGFNEMVLFKNPDNSVFKGVVLGVAENGKLRVFDASSEKEIQFDLKELSFILEN
jgi:BirA family biotin operon repressor/biotin-[acetyl-CoA-carboxylase] ligase